MSTQLAEPQTGTQRATPGGGLGTPQCRNCIFWTQDKPVDAQNYAPENWGYCTRSRGELEHYGPAKPQEGATMVALDGEAHFAILATAPNHRCLGWRSK